MPRTMTSDVEVAYHETGHAVALCVLHRRFTKVSIVPRGNARGWVDLPPSTQTPLKSEGANRRRIFDLRVASFAGHGATAHVHLESAHPDPDEIMRTFSTIMARGSREDFAVALNFTLLHPDMPLASLLDPKDRGDAAARILLSLSRCACELVADPIHVAAIRALASALLVEKTIGHRRARAIIEGAMQNALAQSEEVAETVRQRVAEHQAEADALRSAAHPMHQ